MIVSQLTPLHLPNISQWPGWPLLTLEISWVTSESDEAGDRFLAFTTHGFTWRATVHPLSLSHLTSSLAATVHCWNNFWLTRSSIPAVWADSRPVVWGFLRKLYQKAISNYIRKEKGIYLFVENKICNSLNFLTYSIVMTKTLCLLQTVEFLVSSNEA